MVRKHYIFTGRVQGVGFRYRSAWLARGSGLTGWVRNLSDGRVEMEIQGDEAVIEGVLARLKGDSHIRIDQIDSKDLPLVEKERKFQTKFTY